MKTKLIKSCLIMIIVLGIINCSGVKWAPFSKPDDVSKDKNCEGIEILELRASGAYGVIKYFLRIRNNTNKSRVVTVSFMSVGKKYADGIVKAGEIADIELGVWDKKPSIFHIVECK